MPILLSGTYGPYSFYLQRVHETCQVLPVVNSRLYGGFCSEAVEPVLALCDKGSRR
jgi:hypothetical protein